MSQFEIIENEYQEEIAKISDTLATSIRHIKGSSITNKSAIIKILCKRHAREKSKIKAIYTSRLSAQVNIFNSLKLLFSRRNSFKIF